MTIWHAFFLGIIQGITEFLPISSSGHLALWRHFFEFEQLHEYLLFDLVCHLGTLLAILTVFFSNIKENQKNYSDFLWQIVVATLPLFLLVFALKPIKLFFEHSHILGPSFLFTAAILFISHYWQIPNHFQKKRSLRDSLTIGFFQLIAILPGVSRSGATISVARFLGWQKQEAIYFSFLLAIPAILGGVILEGWNAWHSPNLEFKMLDPTTFIVGFMTSFMIGSLTLRFLIRWIVQDKWIYFAWYCLLLGIATTIYFM